MPVRKFRSVEEIPPPWMTPGDPALFDAIRAVWEFGRRTSPLCFPPGVYRHRSIESLNQLEEVWAQDNFARHRSRCAAPPDPGAPAT